MNKVTIISGYFYPEDTAIGLYNTQLVDYLMDKGYEVSVVTGFPSYPQWKIREEYKNKKTFLIENYNEAKVYRYKQYVPSNPTFFKRILLILDFTIGSFFNLNRIKECHVVISIVPHTSTVLLGWILKRIRKAILWNHIQDFEFDAAKETGIYSEKNQIKKLMFRALFGIERKLLNQGKVNSTISFSMLETLKSKSKSDSFYFPNWIDADHINPSSSTQHPYLRSSNFKILYSGNIGDKQDWDFFLVLARELLDYDVDIVVVGDGAKKNWLCNEIKFLDNVIHYPPVGYEELSNLLCSADLHILFQKNDVVDSVMPSKLLGMMASAKPSLIVGGEESEVKIVMQESQGGFYIENNNTEKCLFVVKQLLESPERMLEIGLNARNYVIDKFSSEKVLQAFERRLRKLVNGN